MNWFILVIALAGLVLNILKKRECFLLWIISNGYWIYHNHQIGETVQAILFAVFAFFSFWGLMIWAPEKKSQLTAATETFCHRILRTQKISIREGNKIKIKWLFTEAKKLLRIIEDEET